MAEARTVVNFKESCVDPLAKLVMLEAMSFAVEKAESRMESLGKIFPGLQDIGKPVIQDIKDIRFAVENMNVCSVPATAVLGGAPPAEPPPSAAIKQLPKREQELVKQMPESLQTALLMELERKPGESAKAPDFWVKGEPVSATKQQKKTVEKGATTTEEKKERTLPTAWGTLEYKGLSYSSPGFFLSQLHGGDVEKIRGKGNYIKQLDAEGFEVYIGNKLVPSNLPKEDIEKLKGVGMRVQLKKGVIKPTPSGGQPVALNIGAYPTPWTIVQSLTGELLYIEDAKKTAIPESVWHNFSGDELDKLAPQTRRVEGRSALGGEIPGLGTRGGTTVKPATD